MVNQPPHRARGMKVLKAVSSPLRLQILNLLFDKSTLSYTELMNQLKMNPRAIDGMRDSLFTRLDVKSRVGLAMHAIRQGIVGI